MSENMKNYWLQQYKEDKVGTIARLSQAMQHMAWLREWQRIHGDEPRIKPITQKVNGEKVKIGESDIAVAWSKLDEFFRAGNEYGDIETVKFLLERIESGDVSELTDKEIHNLSEKENVKWSDGKHSLNPFQGYLYSFSGPNSFIITNPGGDLDFGKFYPIRDYIERGGVEYSSTDDPELDEKVYAWCRFYSTRLLQCFLEGRDDSKYYDFVNFDITSVTTPEQIQELDKKIAEIVKSPEIQEYLEMYEGDAKFEEQFFKGLMEEISIEIKKDSDRIENAHKVFVALETGNLDELLQDPETEKWANEVYETQLAKDKAAKEMADLEERINNPKESGKSKEELAMEILNSQNPGLDEVFWVETVEDDLTNKEKCPYLNQPISKREILLSRVIGKPYPTYFLDGVRNDAHDSYRNEIRQGKTESEVLAMAKYSSELHTKTQDDLRKQVIKEILLNGDSEIGYVESKTEDFSPTEKTQDSPEIISRAMPRKIFELGKKFGIGFPTDIRHVREAYSGSESVYENDFIQAEDCSEAQIAEISKREKQVKKFQDRVADSKDGKFDREGTISLPVFETNNMLYAPIAKQAVPEATISETIDIEVTQRELAEAGILPEDFKWMEKTRISSRDIVEADKEQALTTTEVGGFKGFMKKLLDKFKGIGEK